MGKGQGGLCNLLDVFKRKTKNGFLKTCLSVGIWHRGRKERPRGPGINVFESPDSIVGKEAVSMFVMFMKGKPQNRKKEKASFRGTWEKVSKSVDLPSDTIGQ